MLAWAKVISHSEEIAGNLQLIYDMLHLHASVTALRSVSLKLHVEQEAEYVLVRWSRQLGQQNALSGKRGQHT